jgi:hypothetical protein
MMDIMKTIKLFLLFLIVTSHANMSAMFLRQDDTALNKARRLKEAQELQARRIKIINDGLEQVETDSNPLDLARTKVDEAQKEKWSDAPYVHRALVQHKPKALKAFLEAGASTASVEEKTPMDFALRENFQEGIDILFESKNAKYDCSSASLKLCNKETLVHFCTKIHTLRKDVPKELVALSTAVLTECEPESIKAFIQKGFLHLPDCKAFDDQNADDEEVVTIYDKLLTFAADLPQEPYEKAKKCILRNAIIKNDFDAVVKVVRTHRPHFSPAEEALAWNTHAYILYHTKDVSQILPSSEQSCAPIPDKNFLTAVLNHRLARLDRCNVVPEKNLLWCLNHGANPNGIIEGELKHAFWLINKYIGNKHPLTQILSFVGKDEEDTALYTSTFTLIQQHGSALTNDEWLDHFRKQEYTTRVTKAAFLLKTSKDIILNDERIANIVCDAAESINSDSSLASKAQNIIDSTYLYTSSDRYKMRKYWAAAKKATLDFVTRPSSQPGYLALPTSETSSVSGQELLVVHGNDNDDENKKDK